MPKVGAFVRPVLLGAFAIAWWCTGPWFLPPSYARPPARDGVRIASWNIRNFPDPDQDLDRLVKTIRDLDADVMVMQEVHDPDRLAAVLPERRMLASTSGGRHGQRIAMSYDPDRVTLVGEPYEDAALSLDGHVRPALRATFATDRGRLVVVAVHLKATRGGFDLRQTQWIALVEHVIEAAREGPVVVLGDFNTAGGSDLSAAEELIALEIVLSAAGLHRWPGVRHCTSFWEGVRRDGWLVPSTLDLAFVTARIEARQAWVGGACARHDCDPVHSSDAYPDPDLGRVSDHCPIAIDLPALSG